MQTRLSSDRGPQGFLPVTRGLRWWIGAALLQAPLLSAGPREFAQDPARIPFELNSGKIYVQVAIEDAEPAWFILDAGSPRMILDTSMVESLGLVTGLRGDVRGAGENPFPMVSVRDKLSARIGALELDDLITTAGPLNRVLSPFEGRRVQGVLGVMTVFARFVVEIDYEGEFLTFHEPEGFHYEGDGTVVPLIVRGPRMIVSGKLATHAGEPVLGEFLVDTGLRGALLLHPPFVERHDLLGTTERIIRTTTGGGLGGRVAPDIGRLRYFEVGSVRVNDMPAWFWRSKTDVNSTDVWSGVLGSGFLQRFRVFIDQPGKRLILEQAPVDETRVGFDKSGMFLVAENLESGLLRVLDLVEGGPAEKAGVREGDLLESVGGSSRRSLEEVRRILRGPQGTSIALKVVRDERTLDLGLVLRRLF